MDTPLNGFINAKITNIQLSKYDCYIETDKGYIVAYNPTKCCKRDVCESLSDLLLKDIVGQIIVGVIIKDQSYLGFELTNNISIRISLEDKDYEGPEAFEAWLNTGEIIVN